MASQIFATEAFAFSTVGIARGGQPQVICHIRPDGGSLAKVEAARKAAIQLIEPCLWESKDGAIELAGDVGSEENPQYALVSLLRDQSESRKIIGAILMITRCTSVDDARQRLRMLQG
jgi:hypothetical protein